MKLTEIEYNKKIEQLIYYNRLYDEGTPIISDKEWDDLYWECEQYEKETGYSHPNSPISGVRYDVVTTLKKVTHNHPMLSLDKTKDITVLRDWLKKSPAVVSLKMDGLTVSLLYDENGNLVRAETRGNGVIGEDVTHNALVVKNIPKKIKTKQQTIVDGEIICKYDDFKPFSIEYKHPRNFASGSIRLLDSNESRKRNLSFVAWDLISSNADYNNKLAELKHLGFEVVPFDFVDIHNIEEEQYRLAAIAKDKNYPIDGFVYRYNYSSIYQSMGSNNHGFLGAFAFKTYDEEYETTLLDIEWSVGKTGIITPVAIFEPVNIDGTVVSRASLHNLTIMRSLLGENPFLGQHIWVHKANMIIPQVIRAERKENE